MNDIGQEIYDWLCDRDSIFVKAIITEPEQLRLVEEMCPDAVVASGFTHILPPEILEIPPEGCINLHPGYLPHTRGYFPNIWSIVDDLPPGATLHYMDENIDTGEIIARSKVQKSFEDDGKTVYRRIEDKAVELFKQEWYKIEQGQVETISNDDEIANTYYKRDFDELREINPNETYQAKELIDILRALTFPKYNNAYMDVENNRYYIDIKIYQSE
jgi:methionyl-tRNA formyltransferase